MQTISAMFDDYQAASRAVNRLKATGVDESNISILGGSSDVRSGAATTDADHDETGTGAGTGATLGALVGGGAGLLAGLGTLAIPGIGPIVAAGWLASTLVGATAGGAAGGLIGALTGAGVSETEAHQYSEGIRRGGTLVTVRADDAQVSTITGILDAEGRVNMEERSQSWRNEGWSGRYDETGTGVVTEPHRGAGAGGLSSGSVPVIQEDLTVGKRTREETVRLNPDTIEKPQERDVTLHHEQVRVDRTPVDRPATPEDLARQGKPLETTVRHEEPVIEKQPRVVEEVSLEKEGGQHTETVRDNTRRTDVDIDDQRRGTATGTDDASKRK